MPAVLARIHKPFIALLIATVLAAPAWTSAQSTDTREIEAYLRAVTRPTATDRVTALRDFLRAWPQSSLHADALQWLAWDTRLSDRAVSAGYALELLNIQPANPMATALVMDVQPPGDRDKTYDQAQKAISGLATMRAPAGMGAGEFYLVQQHATAVLCATVGSVELERKDFDSAREYLRRATTIAPSDARYAYALGLADLSGKRQNPEEGYLYMARAVNLAQGTAAAKQIDEYARSRYSEDGGKPGDWDRFLAAAATPNVSASPPPVVAAAAPASSPAAPASPPPTVPSPKVTTAASVEHLPKPSDLPPPKVAEIPVGGLPGPDAAHRQQFRPGAPVSLGILIESSLADKENRRQIVNAVGDMVRHLTANTESEAFVLSFGKNVVFNEDLTGDYRLLEKAMDRIKPDEGTALLDAVTMAAFQLNRVSRVGNNRVLLVISDGLNLDSKMSPLDATAQLESGAVRVYCIGLGALGNDGGRRLQMLAARTGGEAAFVSDSSRLRGATQQIAAKFGVEFPY
jgi:hypothetical protein